MVEASDDIGIDNNEFGIIDIKETEKNIKCIFCLVKTFAIFILFFIIFITQ